MAQSQIIGRNCNYIFLFKINDEYSMKRIIRNHGLSSNISSETIEQFYYYAIEDPLSFLLIDLKTSDDKQRFQKGITEFLYKYNNKHDLFSYIHLQNFDKHYQYHKATQLILIFRFMF